MDELWPLPPFIFNDGLPEAERDAATHIQGQLWHSADYVRDFAAALGLFGYAVRRVRTLKRRADALAATGDAAARAKHYRLMRRAVPITSWQSIAARDGAMTIYHFFTNLAAIDEQLRLRCPTLLSVLPETRFKAAKKLRRQHFKGYEKVRHAVGHAAELLGSLEDVETNALDGFTFYYPVINGVTFSVTIGGQVFSYELTDTTLRHLLQLQSEIFGAFNEADEALRDAHFRATYRD